MRNGSAALTVMSLSKKHLRRGKVTGCLGIARERRRVAGVHIREQVHPCSRETPCCSQRSGVLLVIVRPLGVTREQRECESTAECQREATRPGF